MPFESSPPNTLPVRKAASTASAAPPSQSGIQHQQLGVDVGAQSDPPPNSSTPVVALSGTFSWQFVGTDQYFIRGIGSTGQSLFLQINPDNYELSLVSSLPEDADEPQWSISPTSDGSAYFIVLSSNTALGWTLNSSEEGTNVMLGGGSYESGASASAGSPDTQAALASGPGAHGWLFSV